MDFLLSRAAENSEGVVPMCIPSLSAKNKKGMPSLNCLPLWREAKKHLEQQRYKCGWVSGTELVSSRGTENALNC